MIRLRKESKVITSQSREIIEGNYRNYFIDKLTREIMENKPLGVPDVVFMNFTSGKFSSKTLVSI